MCSNAARNTSDLRENSLANSQQDILKYYCIRDMMNRKKALTYISETKACVVEKEGRSG